MITPPTLELREDIQIPGIPVLWDTNLSNEEISDAYHQLRVKGFFVRDVDDDEAISISKSGGAGGLCIEIRDNTRSFEIRVGGKSCRGRGVRTWIHIVYRPDEEWALIDQEAKAVELNEQERLRKLHEKRELESFAKQEINECIQTADRLRTNNELGKAEQMYRKAVSLRKEHDVFCGSLSVSPEKHLILFLAETRKVIAGLEFLRKIPRNEGLWIDFGLRLSGTGGAQLATEVYKEALKNNPSSVTIHKRLTMHLEGLGDIAAAIAVSRDAIEKGLLRDGTKGGFQGRINRLEKKLKRATK